MDFKCFIFAALLLVFASSPPRARRPLGQGPWQRPGCQQCPAPSTGRASGLCHESAGRWRLLLPYSFCAHVCFFCRDPGSSGCCWDDCVQGGNGEGCLQVFVLSQGTAAEVHKCPGLSPGLLEAAVGLQATFPL